MRRTCNILWPAGKPLWEYVTLHSAGRSKCTISTHNLCNSTLSYAKEVCICLSWTYLDCGSKYVVAECVCVCEKSNTTTSRWKPLLDNVSFGLMYLILSFHHPATIRFLWLISRSYKPQLQCNDKK